MALHCRTLGANCTGILGLHRSAAVAAWWRHISARPAHLFVLASNKRRENEKIVTRRTRKPEFLPKMDCQALPRGWKREETLRRAGLSAGKIEVYYYR